MGEMSNNISSAKSERGGHVQNFCQSNVRPRQNESDATHFERL